MTRINLSVAVLASAALLVAGCGGSSSSPGVAHISSTTSTSTDPSNVAGSSAPENSASAQRKMVAFSQCMRTHGVPEFPEPTEGKLLIHSSDHNGHVSGVNPQSSQFQAASKACEKLAPNGGKPPSPAEQTKMQEKALKFSECMRTHGVPNFPDPEFSHGGGTVRLRIGSKQGGPGGIDPNSPQFQAAQKACQSLMGGPKGGPAVAAPAAGGGGSSSSSSESGAAVASP
ncbi:MAG TPA: hypothetical protein VMB51_08440 [Solirubrobacteraceae bacterium]|nr:hypothetical protein [Solirubrobacteraceae bacterium]